MEQQGEEQKILLKPALESIISRVVDRMNGEGTYWIGVSSIWQKGARWSRNKVQTSLDRRDVRISIARRTDWGNGSATTNQTDDESLTQAVRFAEWQANLARGAAMPRDKPLASYPSAQMRARTWSPETYDQHLLNGSNIIRHVIQRATDAGVIAAGYLEVFAGSAMYRSTTDPNRGLLSDYGQLTQAQGSVTVRHPKGLGSGWAGLSSWDVANLTEREIADRAMDKCLRSMNPVRIEPGRYTAILEPQAVSDLVTPLIQGALLSRDVPETSGKGPFVLGWDEALSLWRSKLGLKIVDERISIWHDPSDPETGIISPALGIQPVTWIKNGVLTTLAHDRSYAINRLGHTDANTYRASYRMSGGTSTLDEMIATTKRGLLVTRFSQPAIMHGASMVSSGLTRDGLWLVENGKISRAVRNFRTLESPLFVLNNIEQLGMPVRVFRPGIGGHQAPLDMLLEPSNALASVIVPSLKIKEFAFTSTIDAV